MSLNKRLNKLLCSKSRILASAAIVLSLWSPSHASMLLDRVVAVVNKDVITWSELYRAMNLDMSPGMKTLSEAERSRILKGSEEGFLEGMIDLRLQLQAARRLDITASNEEIAEAIANIKKKYNMSEEEFAETVKKENYTMAEYRKRLGEQIIISKVVSQQVRNKVVVSDREINEYMAKNMDIGYRIRLIFFKAPDKNITREAVEAKGDNVLRRLKTGDSFALLARQFSEDPSAKEGGDLGYIKKGHLSREFLDVVSNINVGDVSRPFWTERGLHIIRLEERPDTSNPEEFREFAKKKLFDRQFEQEYKNWIRGLRSEAFVDVRL